MKRGDIWSLKNRGNFLKLGYITAYGQCSEGEEITI